MTKSSPLTINRLVKSKAFRFVLVFVVLSLLSLLNSQSPPTQTLSTVGADVPTSSSGTQVNNESYRVVGVTDGDTIAVDINGVTEKIRIIGINTPETVDPRTSVECFGKEALNKAKELLTGKSVSLESDPVSGNRDKYNRLLRYVFLEDTTNYGQLMIQEGYANEYTYGNQAYKYQALYKQAEKEARAAQKGLWSPNTCSGQKTQSNSQGEVKGIETKKTETEPRTFSLPASTQVKTTSESSPPDTTSTETQSFTSFEPKTPTTSSTVGSDKNCDDFTSHQEAQIYFESKGGSKTNNVDKLDRDHDGLACESI